MWLTTKCKLQNKYCFLLFLILKFLRIIFRIKLDSAQLGLVTKPRRSDPAENYFSKQIPTIKDGGCPCGVCAQCLITTKGVFSKNRWEIPKKGVVFL